jgi:hypothetical protein
MAYEKILTINMALIRYIARRRALLKARRAAAAHCEAAASSATPLDVVIPTNPAFTHKLTKIIEAWEPGYSQWGLRTGQMLVD